MLIFSTEMMWMNFYLSDVKEMVNDDAFALNMGGTTIIAEGIIKSNKIIPIVQTDTLSFLWSDSIFCKNLNWRYS